MMAFEVIIRNLVHIFVEAYSEAIDCQDVSATDIKVRNLVKIHVLCYAVVNSAFLPSIFGRWSAPKPITIAT